MSKTKTKYHYFYKITNLINNHFYYGVHNTNNLDDGYIGSGKRLHIAYKKYGCENFKKEILKFFDTSKEAFEYEAEIVTEELVKSNECYNLSTGGDGGWEYWNKEYRHVKDKDGNHLFVSKNDPKYLSGELVTIDKGTSKEKCKGLITLKDKNGNFYKCKINDPRYLNGELVPVTKGKVTVKDKNGNTCQISLDDPRFISGELVGNWKDRHHTNETKVKMHNTFIKNKHQQGEKNSQYGTCWIHNNIENKKIKKEELENYISKGWIKGRKMKFN